MRGHPVNLSRRAALLGIIATGFTLAMSLAFATGASADPAHVTFTGTGKVIPASCGPEVAKYNACNKNLPSDVIYWKLCFKAVIGVYGPVCDTDGTGAKYEKLGIPSAECATYQGGLCVQSKDGTWLNALAFNPAGDVVSGPSTPTTSGAIGPAGPVAPPTSSTTEPPYNSAGQGASWSNADPPSTMSPNLAQDPCERILNYNFNDDSQSDYNACKGGVDSLNAGQSNPTTSSDYPGRFSTGKYQLTYGVGRLVHFHVPLGPTMNIPNFVDIFMGKAMQAVFWLNTTFVHWALWLLSFAFRFTLVVTLSQWTSNLAELINKTYVFGSVVNLKELMFFMLLVYFGFLLLKGKTGKALSELFLSLVIFSLMFVMLNPAGGWYGSGQGANAPTKGPGGYLIGAMGFVGGLSGEVLNLGGTAQATSNQKNATCQPTGNPKYTWCQGLDFTNQGDFNRYLSAKCPAPANSSTYDPTVQTVKADPGAGLKALQQNSDKLLCPIRAQFFTSFVEQPYDLINFGHNLTGDCAKIRDNILATGPWDTQDYVREAFLSSGDKKNAFNENGNLRCGTVSMLDGEKYNGNDVSNWNQSPSLERIFLAVLTLLSSIFALLAIGAVAFTTIAAQLTAAVLLAVAPIALLSGILPGGGRATFIKWVFNLMKVFVLVVVVSAVLASSVLMMHEVLSGIGDVPIYVRFAIFAAMGWGMRRAITMAKSSGNRSMEHLSAKMQEMRAGDAENNRMYARWGAKGGGGGGGGGMYGGDYASAGFTGAGMGSGASGGRGGARGGLVGRGIGQAKNAALDSVGSPNAGMLIDPSRTVNRIGNRIESNVLRSPAIAMRTIRKIWKH